MRICKFTCLLLLIIACAARSFGQVGTQYIDSAKNFISQKKTDKAIEFYIKALDELKKDSADTKIYAFSSYNLGNLYKSIGQYEKALPLYTLGKQLMEKILGKEDLEYIDACNNLALLYVDMAQYDKAEPLFLEVKQVREKKLGKEHLVYAASCDNLAVFYWKTGRFQKAEPLFLEAKALREKLKGKENSDYASSCNNLASLYLNMGQFDKAEPLLLESKQIWGKLFGKEHPNYAASCNNLASLYLRIGQYEKAAAMLLESKQIWEKLLGKQHPNYAASSNNLALVYWRMGQYEKAEPLYLEAKQMREKLLGKEHPDYVASCLNLANFYQDMGQYDKAELLYLEAKQIKEKQLGKTHLDYAACCNNLASLYWKTKQYGKAEPLFLEAKQIQEKLLGKQHPDYAASCNNLALLYQDMGQYEKAVLLYQEGKQVRETLMGKESPEYARSCDNLGLVYQHLGQYDKAELQFLEAKQIQQKVLGKQHADYGQSCENLANIYWLQHLPNQAEKEFETSFLVKTANLSDVFQFTNDKEKAAYIKNVLGEDDKAYSFNFSEKIQSGQNYSLSLFHRNLILSTSETLKKQLYAANDTALANTYAAWTTLKKQLSALYSKPVSERKEDVTKIEEKAGLLEKELSRLSDVFAKHQQKVDWKDIQSKLKTDEASIEFASFHLNNGKRLTDTVMYVAIVLRKNIPLPVTVSLFTEKQLIDLLYFSGNKTTSKSVQNLYVLTNSLTNGKKSAAASIFGLIWKPLEKELAGIKTIYFAPAGMLYRIAFAALPINKKEVLSNRYKLVQLATTASLVNNQTTYITASDKIQLYGDIDYDVDTTLLKNVAASYHTEKTVSRSLSSDLTRGSQWNKLPGTKKEIAEIMSLSAKNKMHSVSFTGLKATEESMKALDGNASPAVLHIATHGFFFPDPAKDINHENNFEHGTAFKSSDNPMMRAGLLFAGANNAWQNKPVNGIDDGILTAYEVSNLYLPNTKLVVLSACETGLGEIRGSEGVYGLQRAFKIAGAQNLVMSLWKVSDLETAAFMETFYKNLFAKQTISDAFYNAQKTIKISIGYSLTNGQLGCWCNKNGNSKFNKKIKQ